MKIAVIGRGLIGSAAARHLAEAGHAPILIGPSEPDDFKTHQGVFGSHYDEGRITRKNATDDFWSSVSEASIARYRALEAISGIQFFSDVGALMVGPDDSAFMSDARAVAAARKVNHDDLAPASFRDAFPDFSFAPDVAALWEKNQAGHISPRRLVAAQTKAAVKSGARVIDAQVMGLKEGSDGARITLTDQALTVDRVLVAAGGMTDHVLGRAITFEVRPRTVTFFHLSEDEATRLQTLPSAVFASGHYLLPPIRYPDGTHRMKLGGEPDRPWLTTPEETADWFRGGGDADVSAGHVDWFRKHLPDVGFTATSMAPCMTAWTDSRRPEIRTLSPHISVAAGGNGAGAKCSDELGRLGARLILDDIEERIAS